MKSAIRIIRNTLEHGNELSELILRILFTSTVEIRYLGWILIRSLQELSGLPRLHDADSDRYVHSPGPLGTSKPMVCTLKHCSIAPGEYPHRNPQRNSPKDAKQAQES